MLTHEYRYAGCLESSIADDRRLSCSLRTESGTIQLLPGSKLCQTWFRHPSVGRWLYRLYRSRGCGWTEPPKQRRTNMLSKMISCLAVVIAGSRA